MGHLAILLVVRDIEPVRNFVFVSHKRIPTKLTGDSDDFD